MTTSHSDEATTITCPACESVALFMVRRAAGLEVWCGTCGELVIDFEVAIARRRKERRS